MTVDRLVIDLYFIDHAISYDLVSVYFCNSNGLDYVFFYFILQIIVEIFVFAIIPLYTCIIVLILYIMRVVYSDSDINNILDEEKLKVAVWFCPLISNRCNIDCVCYINASKIFAYNVDDCDYWHIKKHYCSNYMLTGLLLLKS